MISEAINSALIKELTIFHVNTVWSNYLAMLDISDTAYSIILATKKELLEPDLSL